MVTRRLLYCPLLLVSLLTITLAPQALAVTPPGSQVFLPAIRATPISVALSQIGAPTWRPVDFHVFSAPVGTAPNYSEFYATNCALLPQPNHVCTAAGAPHPPPYDTELARGVADQGFSDGRRFTVAQFSNGSGVYIVWMLVPAPGTTGSSHDFSAGPIISRAVFPISLNGVAYQNSAVYDPALYVTTLVPADDGTAGQSHVPIFIASNTDFGPPGAEAAGEYEYRITLIDSAQNGWVISALFTVAAGA